MNKVLERQLKKSFGDLESVPKNIDTFLQLVDKTYDSAEEDRLLIERSLEISSKEMGALNAQLRADSTELRKEMAKTERMNEFMVDRELKMVALKKEIAELRKSLAYYVASAGSNNNEKNPPSMSSLSEK